MGTFYKSLSRVCMYVLFLFVLFLMWAKPAEYVDDYTEVDAQGHILRVNGKPFSIYLAEKGVDIRNITIEDRDFYLRTLNITELDEILREHTEESKEPTGRSATAEETCDDPFTEKTLPATEHHHHHSHDHHSHHHHDHLDREIREEDKHPYLAVLLTTISAMAASVGGAVVVFWYKPSPTALGSLLAFSAGIMLYISYMDIMVHAQYDLGEHGMLEANLWMFVGMIFFLLLSYLVPDGDGDSDAIDTCDANDDMATTKAADANDDMTTMKTADTAKKQSNLEKMGVITALGISLHNFPEGLVVFNATVVGVCDLPAASFSLHYVMQYLTQCTGRGLAVAIAIALHNIPEGIAVALPIYCSTGSKWQAMKWCLLSSICEPMAAILFGVLFSDFLTMHIMAALNAVVAGIMIILCIYELLPTALQYTNAKNVAIATIAGQFVMFVSLYFLIQTGAH